MRLGGTSGTFLPLVLASALPLLAGFPVVFAATFTPGCGGAAIGESRGMEACTADCSGQECGDDGCGGSCGSCSGAQTCNNISGLCVLSAGLVWTDSIQSGSPPFGFNDISTEYPIDNEVKASDANGANLSRVLDPLGSGDYAMRFYGALGTGGSRAQLSLWSFGNAAFGDLVTSGQPVYVAQEWYFPEAIDAGGDVWAWLNLWDWHSTAAGGDNRWHTAPGLMLNQDGSMRVAWQWGSGPTPDSTWSTAPLPVGEWFDIEMRYQWSSNSDVTLQLWVNGSLILQQNNVKTAASNHQNVETYIKLYGDDQGHTPWSPTPVIKYTRNVRVSGQRIWQ